MRLLLVALVMLPACSWFQPEDRRRVRRPDEQPGMAHLAPGAIPEGSPRRAPGLSNGPTLDDLPDGAPGLVVLVVLDTVRADHLSACGYPRPTSPTLQGLADKGAAHTCRAYAPATWTIPSHASLFTGLDPEDHGVLGRGVPLRDDTATLAEQFAERGYQTMLLSANPILKPATGLTRGFHRVQVAPGLHSNPLRGKGLAQLLRYELAQIDPKRPLFLVLNVYDAHEPYPAVPRDTSFGAPQPELTFRRDQVDHPTYAAWKAGELSEEAADAWVRQVVDGYDQGILEADTSLGRLMRILDKHEMDAHGVRLVVTSDHGEHLGEHGLMRHDGPPWEGVARIPLWFLDTGLEAQPELPEPFSLTDVHALVLDGAVPGTPRPVRSGSIAYGGTNPQYRDALAWWPSTARKLMWLDDDIDVRDPATDEVVDAPASSAETTTMTTAVEAHMAAKARALEGVRDEKILKLLDRLGYVDGEAPPTP